jgi:hypothetical protein
VGIRSFVNQKGKVLAQNEVEKEREEAKMWVLKSFVYENRIMRWTVNCRDEVAYISFPLDRLMLV